MIRSNAVNSGLCRRQVWKENQVFDVTGEWSVAAVDTMDENVGRTHCLYLSPSLFKLMLKFWGRISFPSSFLHPTVKCHHLGLFHLWRIRYVGWISQYDNSQGKVRQVHALKIGYRRSPVDKTMGLVRRLFSDSVLIAEVI